MKVAIIGCGNIGTSIADFIIQDPFYKLHSLSDINKKNIQNLLKQVNQVPKFLALKDAIEEADLIIEAANKEVVGEILLSKNIDSKNKRILVMSTGGLIEETTMNVIRNMKHCEVHIPSGAIAGLDAIQAIAGEIDSLKLKTVKPPQSLSNSPFIRLNNIQLSGLKTKTVIFKGGLKEAIAGFPQNINIAASLFLASRFDDIKIQIIADPNTQFNTHTILCKGKFGEINIKTENFPSNNPKTSYLAIQSAISILKNITSNLKIGN